MSSSRRSTRPLHPIQGDDLEQHRRQLESNPTINNISIALSDVEYPRHHESLHPDIFASFDYSHPWSQRTGEDEDGFSPYTGATVSTAAHHASALTLSAGLGNGRNTRRDSSASGAEYDPDRPVHDVISGSNSGHIPLDLDMSKSKHLEAGVSLDPLVVDSTSELDRILQSGLPRHFPRTGSPAPSSGSSDSDAAPSHCRLSEALNRIGISPRRPRDGSPRPQRPQDDATPRPLRTTQKIFPRYGPVPSPQPAAQSQSPALSTTGSKFSRMAKGLAKEIQTETQRSQNPDRARAGEDMEHDKRKDVILPDVTGLTSAVESPAKADAKAFTYLWMEGQREGEARILATLRAVQSKLLHLESQNGISRRRVRELEMELESCKEDVRRERTRVLEREEVIAVQHAGNSPTGKRSAAKTTKGKAKATELNLGERYREVVEEKKALEALIACFRAHLARLTSELSSHQVLLSELRSMRDSDAKRLKSKEIEVERLQKEVERLAGEVEVLKGVVEEGLKERRSARNHVIGTTAEAATPDDEGEEGQELKEEQTDPDEAESYRPPYEGHCDESSDHESDEGASRTSASSKSASRRFIDSAELQRISMELNDRRFVGSPLPPRSQLPPVPASQFQEQPAGREIDNASSPPARLRSRPAAPTPAHALGSQSTNIAPANVDVLEVPFPQIRGENLERLFFSAPEHNVQSCPVCHRKRRALTQTSYLPSKSAHTRRLHTTHAVEDEGFAEGSDDGRDAFGKLRERPGFVKHAPPRKDNISREKQPPQTVLAHVLQELEDDFTHYKGIYVELAEQYKEMDAVSNVRKRNILAQHLKEVVDILEQKGDQIASLYDLLSFKDKPMSESAVPSTQRSSRPNPTY